MTNVTGPPRVAYLVSGDLISYADLLPSNEGRSSIVHSLVHHLDLLDHSALDQDHDKGEGSSRQSDKAQLLRALNADASNSVAFEKPRAKVYLPTPATHQQLAGYHQESFVRQLTRPVQQDSNKRRKIDDSDADSNASNSASGEDDEDDNANTDDAGELHLRSSSQVSGPSRERGYKRPNSKHRQFGLSHDCPTFPGLSDHVALIAGASITAAELLATGQADIAIAWDGGRHHAKKDSASGFCYINDVVLAILQLRKPRKTPVTATDEVVGSATKSKVRRVDRVLYLDLDLHWGDGVEEAFHTSPNVLTLSIHHYATGFFPCYSPSSDPAKHGPPGSLTGDAGAGGKSFNIPLGLGTNDASLERVMDGTVQPLVDAWNPEMVVVQCGVDGLAGDPMSVWNLSSAAYVNAVSRVLEWKKPTLLLGGGGYQSENAARCWSSITALCLGRFHHDDKKRHADRIAQDELTPLTQQTESKDRRDRDETEVGEVGYGTAIPDHKFWPNYAPDYTLGVPAGEMIDQNDEAHFEAINKIFFKRIANITSK